MTLPTAVPTPQTAHENDKGTNLSRSWSTDMDTPDPRAAQRPTWTRSFAAATWLLAKGFEIEGVELARDGSGGAVFKFPPGLAAHIEDFHRAKNKLNELAISVRNGR